MTDLHTPLTDEYLDMAQKVANSLIQSDAEGQIYRNLIIDLLAEVRTGRDVWKMATETFVGFRRQLLDELSGEPGHQSLMVVCRSCRNSPAGCNASGCGGRQALGWRGQIPAAAVVADEPQIPQIDAQVLLFLDPVLWGALKALERGTQVLTLQGEDVPPVIAEMITVLRGLIDQSEIAQGRPY